MIIYLNILPSVRKNIYNKTTMSISKIKSFKLVMLGLSSGLFISFLVNAIPLPEYISIGLSIVKDISILELIFRLFGTVILVPIVEEILFRGVLLDQISDKIPSVLAILISSIAFSFFHNDYVQMIYTFIMGMIFAITYLKVKNIFAPIIVHIIYNFKNKI
jgi:membrane protease YdiL (CAAX protease family)